MSLAVAGTPGRARADISIGFITPGFGSFVQDELVVQVAVMSTFQIEGVRAAVGETATDLAFSADSSWVGTLSMAGMEGGSKRLVVTVTDIFGEIGRAELAVMLDRPPVITFLEPIAETVARPEVRLRVSCTDDDPRGCESVGVRLADPGIWLVIQQREIDTAFSFANFDGQWVRIQAEGRDRAGQTTATEWRTLYVEGSDKLVEVASAPGVLFDFDEARVLWRNDSDYQLFIRDRASGVDTALPQLEAGAFPETGGLTKTGALWVWSSIRFQHALAEFDMNTLIDHGPVDGTSAFLKAGGYAAWCTGATLYLRDLVVGETVQVANNAVNVDNTLLADGSLAYWTVDGGDIRVYRDGLSSVIADHPTLTNGGPVYDGLNVAYWQGNGPYSVLMHDGTREITLASGFRDPPARGYFYQVAGGWAAYARQVREALQVFRRSPSGVDEQMTVFGSDSYILAMAPTGHLIIRNGFSIYRPIAGRPPERLGALQGNWFYRDGAFYMMLGRSAFRVLSSDPTWPGATPSGPEPDPTMGPDGGAGGDTAVAALDLTDAGLAVAASRVEVSGAALRRSADGVAADGCTALRARPAWPGATLLLLLLFKLRRWTAARCRGAARGCRAGVR